MNPSKLYEAQVSMGSIYLDPIIVGSRCGLHSLPTIQFQQFRKISLSKYSHSVDFRARSPKTTYKLGYGPNCLYKAC